MAKVLIKTTEGDIKVRLYDETPQHRDNFLKLAKDSWKNDEGHHGQKPDDAPGSGRF